MRAKSGELEMLVVGWDGEHVVCEWVEREVVIERELFLPEELVLVRKA